MAITLKGLAEKAGVKPDMNGGTRCKTPVFRSSYAFVHEPKETQSGDMKYQICMIFKKADLAEWKAVAQAICNAAAKKFGEDINKWPKNLKCPMRDGDEDRDGAEYEGAIFMNGGTKNKPGLVDRVLNPIMSRDEFYSGCYARASLTFYPYDVKGNKGVGTGLNNLIFWEEGDRLDGSVKAEDDFADWKDESKATASAPSDNFDDDIPF